MRETAYTQFVTIATKCSNLSDWDITRESPPDQPIYTTLHPNTLRRVLKAVEAARAMWLDLDINLSRDPLATGKYFSARLDIASTEELRAAIEGLDVPLDLPDQPVWVPPERLNG